jgi:hypothetical protein
VPRPPKTGPWRSNLRDRVPGATLRPGCTPAALKSAEKKLRLRLPADLAAFLLETDGAKSRWGIDLVWPLAEIVQTHLTFRSDFRGLYMSFDGLLFFGAAGNGDQYGFRVLEDAPADVFLWDHEDDSRQWFARGLEDYFERIGKEASAEAEVPQPEPSRPEGVVSVWVGDHESRESFRSYTSMGAGLFRHEGDPSLLEDFKLEHRELTSPREVRVSWQPQPATIAALVGGLWEAEHFAAKADEAAHRKGRTTARCVLIVYGLEYDPSVRGVSGEKDMVFVGSFRYR